MRTVWTRLRSSAPRQSSSLLSAMRAPPPPPTLLNQHVNTGVGGDGGINQPGRLGGIADIGGVSRNCGAGGAQCRQRLSRSGENLAPLST
jgi:hypothetical protein